MENDNSAMLILTALIVFALLLIVFILAKFFTKFNDKTRHILAEMNRADYNGYCYWRKELSCHYLCLIPFVNEKNAPQLYHHLYYRPKHAETQRRRSDGLSHLLAPSVIGACICAVCLCGTSWAWMTAVTTTEAPKIQTAAYAVSVTATLDENEIASTTTDGGATAFALKANKEYHVNITPTGTAANGYCKVNFENGEYYTVQLQFGTTLSFTVYPSADGTLTVTPAWGICTIDGQKIGSGENDLKEIGTKSENDAKAQSSPSPAATVTPGASPTPAASEPPKNTDEMPSSTAEPTATATPEETPTPAPTEPPKNSDETPDNDEPAATIAPEETPTPESTEPPEEPSETPSDDEPSDAEPEEPAADVTSGDMEEYIVVTETNE